MDKLPPNLVCEVLSFLAYKEIVQVSGTSKGVYKGSLQERLWRELCLKQWTFCRKGKYSSWRDCFIGKMKIREGMLRGSSEDYEMVACRRHTDYITTVLLLGEAVVSGTVNGEVCVWTPEGRDVYHCIELRSHRATVEFIAVYEGVLWTATMDGQIFVYNIEYPNFIHRNEFTIEIERISDLYIENDIVYIWGNLEQDAVLLKKHVENTEFITLFNSPSLMAAPNLIIENNSAYVAGSSRLLHLDLNSGAIKSYAAVQNLEKIQKIHEKIIVQSPGQISLYSPVLSLIVTSPAIPLNSAISIYESSNTLRVTYISFSTLTILSLINNQFVPLQTVSFNFTPHSLHVKDYNLTVSSNNNSVHIFSANSLAARYVLLGGTMNPRLVPKSFVPHPTLPGCSFATADETKIVASFGNLLRIYNFDN